MGQAKETKSIESVATKVIDADQGIVEQIVAVMGNVDRGGDIIHPGAFSKSIQERGLKLKGLDQHNRDSVRRVVSKPLAMRELGQSELPPELLLRYPDANGALWVKAQYTLATQAGREVFALIKDGMVDEYSIGYDPIQMDYTTIETSEGKKTVRNLREVRLWEYSAVIDGMNPATATLSAKDDQPGEGKPWDVFEQDGRFCVYKVDGDGNQTGESLGCHDTRGEAEGQMRALYASEPEAGAPGTGAGGAVVLDGKAAPDIGDIKAGRRVRHDRIEQAKRLVTELTDFIKWATYEDAQDEDEPAPEKAAVHIDQAKEAGPAEPPTSSDMCELVAVLELETNQLEV